MTVVLKPMTAEEFEQYKKHSIQIYSQGMLDQGEYPSFAAAYKSGSHEVNNFYATLREGESNHPFNIFDQQRAVVVGYLVYSYLIRRDQSKIAFVDYIEVFEQFQRQGYAKQAMKLMEEQVKQDGLDVIELNVMLNKVGPQKLYGSLGYQYMRPRYLGPIAGQITRFDMRKQLS